MEARFGRVLTAMITPFDADGSLDLDGAQKLARWLVGPGGNDGLVIAGTTGESPTLSQDEQIDLIAAVVDAVDVPVVAGAGSNNTASAIENTRRATEAGAAGLLHVAGYYNKPSQAGLFEHFRVCAEATDLPILLYDIPGRTNRKIATETIVDLIEAVPNIVGVKDAAGNPAETSRLLSIAPEGTQIYSGDDGLTLPLLSIGAVGCIGVATHWVGNEVREMMSAFFAGDVLKATAINRRLVASYRFETSDLAPNPVPSKAMMRVMGLPSGPCRLPMGPEPDGLETTAKSILADLGKG